MAAQTNEGTGPPTETGPTAFAVPRVAAPSDKSLAVARRRYQASRARRLCAMCDEMARMASDDFMAQMRIEALCRDLELNASISESMVETGQPFGGRFS